jgi:hypothetical protein
MHSYVDKKIYSCKKWVLQILTPRKVKIRCQLMVPSDSSDDDLPLVKHDAQVVLKPAGARIRDTQEPALMLI